MLVGSAGALSPQLRTSSKAIFRRVNVRGISHNVSSGGPSQSAKQLARMGEHGRRHNIGKSNCLGIAAYGLLTVVSIRGCTVSPPSSALLARS